MSRPPGRIKKKMVEVLLHDAGLVVDINKLRVNYNRRPQDDQCRWWCRGYYKDDPAKVVRVFFCYDKMTDCVRWGIELGEGRSDGFIYASG